MFMRILMWFSLGFAGASLLGTYGLFSAWLVPLGLLFFLLSLTCFAMRHRASAVQSVALVLLGCGAGLLWFVIHRNWYLKPLEKLDGVVSDVSFTVSDYSVDTQYGVSADGIIRLDEKDYQVKAYLEENTVLKPGDTVSGTFRHRLTSPEAMEASSYYSGKGVFFLLYQQEQIHLESAGEIPARFFPAVLRLKIREILYSAFPEDTVSFVQALLLGDDSGLDYETDTALRISGIRHIIAVSGLHISILYGLISFVTFRRRYLTATVAMPVLLLFAAVAGFTPSVTRACIMVWLMLLAGLFDREYDPATALSFAVLVMLAVNPLAAGSVSLQMSVSCVAGILLFEPPITRWMKQKCPVKKGRLAKVWGILASSASVSLSAVIPVTPLCAVYFGTVSLISVVTNVLTFWAVNLVFNGIIVVCLLFYLLPGIAAALAWLLAWPIRYVLFAARTMAAIPMAAVYTKSSYIVLWLVFVYILLGAFLIMKKKQPGVLACCAVVGLCFALTASWLEPMLADTRITMLDVGQGQAILLQNQGKTFLVDCGGDDDEKTADIIAETLLSQGISRLDGIVLTHYDRDHAGALNNLLTRIDTDLLFLPDIRHDLKPKPTEGQTLWVWEDLELSFGNSRLVIYGPIYSGQHNENSLCVLFDTENCDILITGDRTAFGERMLMRNRKLPDVDILVAGHHGDGNATSDTLLSTVAPEMVLISVEKDNIYGHPSPELLHRLEVYGCSVFRTDLNGTITIRR